MKYSSISLLPRGSECSSCWYISSNELFLSLYKIQWMCAWMQTWNYPLIRQYRYLKIVVDLIFTRSLDGQLLISLEAVHFWTIKSILIGIFVIRSIIVPNINDRRGINATQRSSRLVTRLWLASLTAFQYNFDDQSTQIVFLNWQLYVAFSRFKGSSRF